MSFGELIDKPVRHHFGPTSKARAKKIRQLGQGDRNLGMILLDIYYCIELAKHWDKLSPTERIMLEQKWTDSLLALLSIGNFLVTRSIRYRLREQTPEEDKIENAV